MRRREFIAGAASAVAWPLTAFAQQGQGVRRIGVLMSTSDDSDGRLRVVALRRGLQELGWTEGRNVQVELHWGDGNTDLVERYAEQLVEAGTNVLVAGSTAALVALRNRTKTIPIVFAQVSDPVGQGYVESLARPGGNITGFTNFEPTMTGKWLDLLKQMAPGIYSVALIYNPATAPYFDYYLRSLETSVPSLSMRAAPVHSITEIEIALMALSSQPNAGLVVLPDTFTTVNRKLVISLVARFRIPTIYTFRYFVADGGLISYGSVTDDLFRRAASYVDRILRGERPADLPVQQPTKFELVINLKPAKALGLEIPTALLALADEVIE